MAVKKKDPRGRKEINPMDHKVPVRIFVKRRNLAKATKECAAIAAKYR